MSTFRKTAFTLIELLVVIAIIGILSGLIVVSMSGITEKANISKAQVFSNSLKNSIMLNLVSEWKLDENTGQTTSDSWGGGNNCTIGSSTSADDNDPTWVSDCVYGKCLSFDGINDYVNCGKSSSLDPTNYLTVSVWFKTNILTGTQTMFMRNGPYRAHIINGYLNYGIHTGSWILQTHPKLLSQNQWYHIAMTWDINNGNVLLYLNGEKYNGGLTTTTAMTIVTAPFMIGSDTPAYDRWYFSGLIDDVKFYNAAMPASQIKENYYTGLNSLFINGTITREEYLSRIESYGKY